MVSEIIWKDPFEEKLQFVRRRKGGDEYLNWRITFKHNSITIVIRLYPDIVLKNFILRTLFLNEDTIL